MISLRYHIVSIAAVFLALAVGVVLGSTSASERLLSNVGGERDSLSKQTDDLRGERAALNTKLRASERFGRAVGPLAVRGQLDRRSVVLLTTWDASPRDRDATRALLTSAGATVTGELGLTESLADPARADQLRQVITRLLPPGVQLPEDTGPGTMAGGLLGPLTMLDPRTGQPQVSPGERAAALGALTHSGFVDGAADFPPAQLAVIVTGGEMRGDESGDRAATLARLATQVDRSGGGAVLAGASGSAGGHGPVGTIRADTAMPVQLSTVDNVDSPAGRVATVLALREQENSQAGHYGTAASAQGPAPDARG